LKSIAFFNNKGGVGKTSLIYHLAWMFAERGIKVLAVDLDPQANLTSMFLDEERLETLWPDGDHPHTVYGAIAPILRGIGDIAQPHVEMLTPRLGLVPGDLGLSRFEDKLSDAWPRCHNRDEAAFRTMTAFHRVVLQGAQWGADIALLVQHHHGRRGRLGPGGPWRHQHDQGRSPCPSHTLVRLFFEECHESEVRHCRPAQRREIHTVQCVDQGRDCC